MRLKQDLLRLYAMQLLWKLFYFQKIIKPNIPADLQNKNTVKTRSLHRPYESTAFLLSEVKSKQAPLALGQLA